MASKFVRGIRQVKDVSKLAEYVTEPNDIVQDLEGNVYIRLEKGFAKITGSSENSDVITQIKKDVQTNKTATTNNKKAIDTNTKGLADLETRIKALEDKQVPREE